MLIIWDFLFALYLPDCADAGCENGFVKELTTLMLDLINDTKLVLAEI